MSSRSAARPSTDSGSRVVPQINVLSPSKSNSSTASSQAKPKSKKPRRPIRDTGFPEPFDCGRTTTLPHPEADLSPNATISSHDVGVEHVLKRQRLSFLKKHHKNLSHGVITPQTEALHSVLSLTFTDTDAANKDSHKLVNTSTTSLRLSRDDGASLRSKRGDHDDDTPPTSPDLSEHRRSKGLLAKLRRKS
ncbi:hypothetical protein CDD82_7335 [Ophiocordyceps australis]|uniref:Uncharacterized protein n=1 Tax=Ophiocordyceps australis TaxID=1399860 RepID=A0A2C5XW57_9HYPO|nr:hypothetical protein CDD82_7335 [Ophiocordyceps australis]